MGWCNLQTNEYDLQAKMYPIVRKYHRLNINRLNTYNWNKVPVFPRYICNRWQNMVAQPPQTHNHGKIWQQWERWILPILVHYHMLSVLVNISAFLRKSSPNQIWLRNPFRSIVRDIFEYAVVKCRYQRNNVNNIDKRHWWNCFMVISFDPSKRLYTETKSYFI